MRKQNEYRRERRNLSWNEFEMSVDCMESCEHLNFQLGAEKIHYGQGWRVCGGLASCAIRLGWLDRHLIIMPVRRIRAAMRYLQ